MSSLRSSIQTLADQFASGVIAAIRSASLEDILAETGGGRPAARTAPRPAHGTGNSGGSRGRAGGRRSPADLSAVADSIVGLVARHPGGLRAEQIRAQLGIPRNALLRPLALAVSSRRLSKRGHKRSTTYTAIKR